VERGKAEKESDEEEGEAEESIFPSIFTI